MTLKTGSSEATPASVCASPGWFRRSRCPLQSKWPTRQARQRVPKSSLMTVAFAEYRGQNCRAVAVRSFVQLFRLMAKSKKSNRLDGCTFTLVAGMIMVALFVANGIFVRAFLPRTSALDDRIYQPLQFALPIIMMFFEYWIWDRFMRRFFQSKSSR